MHSWWNQTALGRLTQLAVLSSLLGFVAACEETPPSKPVTPPPPEATPEPPPSATPPPPPPPSASAAPVVRPVLPPLADSLKPIEHSGPYFVATSGSVGIYPDPETSRRDKLGYMRRGGRVPVLEPAIKKDNCKKGWFAVVGGGYVCAEYGSVNPDHPEVKLGTQPPNLGEILPYRYARNSKNGTPMYKSVPTREQMHQYEPYLKSEKAEKEKAKPAKVTPAASTAASAAAIPASSASIPALGEGVENPAVPPPPPPPETEGGDEGEKSWWQRDDADDHLHKVTLPDLAKERDDLLAQRMIKGFYVAIDKIFNWNDRSWYKTTQGMIVPADRFWLTDAFDFAGTEVTAEHNLPLGWVYGSQKERPKYEIDPETKKATPAGSVKHFTAVGLTGDELKVGNTTYVAASEGFWMKKEHLRIAELGELPQDIGPDEHWIDVDLSSQTLVAFIGSTPVFATLISSGKESTIKAKDHSTPRGQWPVREKHITSTMDGDGTAAGDLPYSIEDVPYVMYFHKAYALHGAFWHRNYGTRMSHGCINLAPLDAKRLFFFAGPPVPQGWHGAWSREGKAGSRIVVHD